jgi:hypothetical protein
MEKAMAKNMFDDNNKGKGLNIFDAVAFDPTKSRIPNLASAALAAQVQANEAMLSSQKGSKKSNKSNASVENKQDKGSASPVAGYTQSSEVIMNEEAAAKAAKSNNTPSMFKIANKLKLFTDLRLKKTQSDTSALVKLSPPAEQKGAASPTSEAVETQTSVISTSRPLSTEKIAESPLEFIDQESNQAASHSQLHVEFSLPKETTTGKLINFFKIESQTVLN